MIDRHVVVLVTHCVAVVGVAATVLDTLRAGPVRWIPHACCRRSTKQTFVVVVVVDTTSIGDKKDIKAVVVDTGCGQNQGAYTIRWGKCNGKDHDCVEDAIPQVSKGTTNVMDDNDVMIAIDPLLLLLLASC